LSTLGTFFIKPVTQIGDLVVRVIQRCALLCDRGVLVGQPGT